MNREEILQASRKENKNQDLAELEIKAKAASWACFAGMAAILVVFVLSRTIAHIYLYAPVFIYFSMLCVEWVYRFVKVRRTSDLVIALLMGALSLIALYGFVCRLSEVAG